MSNSKELTSRRFEKALGLFVSIPMAITAGATSAQAVTRIRAIGGPSKVVSGRVMRTDTQIRVGIRIQPNPAPTVRVNRVISIGAPDVIKK